MGRKSFIPPPSRKIDLTAALSVTIGGLNFGLSYNNIFQASFTVWLQLMNFGGS